jgi:hypothetical protein
VRLLSLGAALLVAIAAPAEARMHTPYRGHRIVAAASDPMASAALVFDFAAGTYVQAGVPACISATTCLTVSRTGVGATNLLSTSPSGFAYTTYPADTMRIIPGAGILIEGNRTNRLLNSATPATQTTAVLNCSAGCTLWVNGSGSATPSAGTATGCTGFATSSQGVPVIFSCSGNGTITVTVSGALNAAQLETGAGASSFIVTAGAAVARAQDAVTVTVPPVFGSAYSFLASATPLAPASSTALQSMLSVDDGTNTNFVTLRRMPATGQIQFGSTPAAFLFNGTAAMATGVPFKSAGATSVATASAAFSGGELLSSVATTLPAGLNAMRIGQAQPGAALQPAYAYISQIAYWPVRLSDADLLRLVQ